MLVFIVIGVLVSCALGELEEVLEELAEHVFAVFSGEDDEEVAVEAVEHLDQQLFVQLVFLDDFNVVEGGQAVQGDDFVIRLPEYDFPVKHGVELELGDELAQQVLVNGRSQHHLGRLMLLVTRRVREAVGRVVLLLLLLYMGEDIQDIGEVGCEVSLLGEVVELEGAGVGLGDFVVVLGAFQVEQLGAQEVLGDAQDGVEAGALDGLDDFQVLVIHLVQMGQEARLFV